MNDTDIFNMMNFQDLINNSSSSTWTTTKSKDRSSEKSDLAVVHSDILRASNELSRLRKERKISNDSLLSAQNKCEIYQAKINELLSVLNEMTKTNQMLKDQNCKVQFYLGQIEELKLLVKIKDDQITQLENKLKFAENSMKSRDNENLHLQSIYQASVMLKKELNTEDTESSQ